MLAAEDLTSFDRDGFVTVGRVLESQLVGELRERFKRLFLGVF